jgi:hypothetical protein
MVWVLKFPRRKLREIFASKSSVGEKERNEADLRLG